MVEIREDSVDGQPYAACRRCGWPVERCTCKQANEATVASEQECPDCGHTAPHTKDYGCNEQISAEALCPCWTMPEVADLRRRINKVLAYLTQRERETGERTADGYAITRLLTMDTEPTDAQRAGRLDESGEPS